MKKKTTIRMTTKLNLRQRLMQALLLVWTCSGASVVLADDHTGQAASSSMTQVNLCYLNEGKTMADVEALNTQFFAWLKEKDLDPYSILITPVANASPPLTPTYEFIEMLTGPYERIGQMWEQIQGTEQGQQIAADWAEIATCGTRLAHLVHKFRDQEVLAGTDTRIVQLTRCEVQPTEPGTLRKVHDEMLADRSNDATNMYWGLILPGAGGEPGVFRHMVSFPSMSAYTAAFEQRNAPGAWQRQREYNEKYADCDGASVWAGRVQNRPG